MGTLYSQLKELEERNKTYVGFLENLKKASQVDPMLINQSKLVVDNLNEIEYNFEKNKVYKKMQYCLLEENRENPVLYSAIQGNQSISETLQELNQINKGIKLYLPHKKTKTIIKE